MRSAEGITHNHLVDQDPYTHREESKKKGVVMSDPRSINQDYAMRCGAIALDHSDPRNLDVKQNIPSVHQSTEAEWPIFRITSGAMYSETRTDREVSRPFVNEIRMRGSPSVPTNEFARTCEVQFLVSTSGSPVRAF